MSQLRSIAAGVRVIARSSSSTHAGGRVHLTLKCQCRQQQTAAAASTRPTAIGLLEPSDLLSRPLLTVLPRVRIEEVSSAPGWPTRSGLVYSPAVGLSSTRRLGAALSVSPRRGLSERSTRGAGR
jgi:hypothetical protein